MKTVLGPLGLIMLAIVQAGCGSSGDRAAASLPAATATATATATVQVDAPAIVAPQPAPARLTALSAIPGVPAWSTTGGNPGHTNYVPATFDPAKFSRRFSWPLPAGAAVSQAQLALDGGQAFAVVRDAAGTWRLHAIDEASGKQNWTALLGQPDIVDPPATHDGKVVLSSAAGLDGDALWFFDQRTGKLLDKRTMPARRTAGHSTADLRMAPVIAGDGIYVNDRAGGKLLAKFDVSTHALLWESEWAGAANHAFAPAVEGNRVYAAFSSGGLLAVDTRTGKTVLEHHRQFTDAPMPGMVSDGSAYALAAGGLVATDLKRGTFKWQGPELLELAAPPGPVLYGIASDAIQAIDRATGKLLWSMPTPAPTSGSNAILATRNLLFISSTPQSNSGTYAIDIATRKVVWRTPEGGWLSISPNGVLYITPFEGAVTAVNLQS
ncbi:PQQ-binding-like beta-propeller repeat protein [Massilia phyllosphaerae]|uniref:PQQ-binding-like beta-propeller repeat protein n=1 Tax=Massilia phyllosphaerae TaxID=3106034 RepID=UPI002B1CDEDA|nr:PQQ-binding-like beta-propeller repeat protein [Massilia sp. SGZ-792]